MNDYNNRPKFQGNWTCSKCGKDITELPFEPRDTSTLECFDCHKSHKRSFGNDRGPSRKFEGNWKCCDCGASITTLPFEPRDTSTLKCFDCLKKSR